MLSDSICFCFANIKDYFLQFYSVIILSRAFFGNLTRVGPTMYTYIRQEIRVYIGCYMCLSGHNGIYELYRELQWRFSKDESCSGVSQIAENWSGIYPINP